MNLNCQQNFVLIYDFVTWPSLLNSFLVTSIVLTVEAGYDASAEIHNDTSEQIHLLCIKNNANS